jgi:hypothetical protein
MVPRDALRQATALPQTACTPQSKEQKAIMVEMHHPPDPAAFARMNTAEMLFVPGKIKMPYSHVDRAALGAGQ